MDRRSFDLMKPYLNTDSMLKMIAFQLSKQNMDLEDAYKANVAKAG